MASANDTITKLIRAAGSAAARESESEAEPEFSMAVEWPVTAKIGLGLEGAIASETHIGYVNGPKGRLSYCGHDIFELAAESSYVETAYLLLFGKLPTSPELSAFRAKLNAYRDLNPETLNVLRAMPVKQIHPMVALGAGVLALAATDEQANVTTVEAETEAAVRLIAAMPSITAAVARLRCGEEPIKADPQLDHSANFLYMLTGSKPSDEFSRILDVSLILHADHGMNASTFAAMVVNSSLSDMYMTVGAGIASLKGPLHGGANEQVLYTLEEIGPVDAVKAWFQKVRQDRKKIMGFGHRVYKAYDPRARILKPLAAMLAERNAVTKPLFEVADKLEQLAIEELGKEKGIFPNVDFYSGLVYQAMAIDTPIFTPIFAVARVVGWTARVLEYLQNNRIFRPRATYVGPVRVKYTPIDQR